MPSADGAPAQSPMRRSWLQRCLIFVNVVLIIGWVGAAGAGAYLFQRVGRIPTIDFDNGVLGPQDGVPDDPGGPKNYLLVGSDTREGQDLESFGSSAETGEARADTIILVRVDPRSAKAAVVSFPRDLFIPIYDTAGNDLGRDRINTAFAGGPEQLISTIRRNFDVPIDHYVQMNFTGFRDVVDAVGGVEVYLPGPVRDRDQRGRNVAGLNIVDSGCVRLDGNQALAYVRSRHFEQFVDGRWQADLSSDLGRISRQQDFIRRIVRKSLSSGLSNPAQIIELLDVAEDNLVVDDSLSATDVVAVGRRFKSLTPDTLDQRSLAVEDFRTPAGARVLRLLDSVENDETFSMFRGDPVVAERVVPAMVQVRVLNGTGRAGQASDARDGLVAAGFNVVGIDDSPASTDVTTVRYGRGQEDKAQLLARYLPDTAELVADGDLTVDAVVTTGEDFTSVRSAPRAAAPTAKAQSEPAAAEDTSASRC